MLKSVIYCIPQAMNPFVISHYMNMEHLSMWMHVIVMIKSSRETDSC